MLRKVIMETVTNTDRKNTIASTVLSHLIVDQALVAIQALFIQARASYINSLKLKEMPTKKGEILLNRASNFYLGKIVRE